MSQVFDTHAHYDDKRFDKDRDSLLAALPERGVGLVLIPGCDVPSSQAARDYAGRFPHVYFAAGVHPSDALDVDDDALAVVESLLTDPKCAALGEVGLDYHYRDAAPREVQRNALERQLALAERYHKPVIFHDREAHGDSCDIVRAHPTLTGVFHCFAGSAEMARQLIGLGWYISFTGVLTFKNAHRVREVAAKVPLERILLETDAPYMAPEPWRGKRCDSTMIRKTAEELADLHGVTTDTVIEAAWRNGVSCFGL